LKLRFTFISLGVGWKRNAVLRRAAKAKTRKKAEKHAVLRSAERRACGVVGGVRRVGLCLSRLSFALRRLGAAGGTIMLRHCCRITNARLLRRGASARR
jgi:hypothetical protein